MYFDDMAWTSRRFCKVSMPSEVTANAVVPANESSAITVIDLQLTELTPVRKRTARKNVFDRLEANIRAVGLIEPLLVYRDKGQHFIIDGYLRFQVLQSMGVKEAPCLIIETLDCYTPNWQVNYLSRSQRWGMIKRALTDVNGEVLKKSLGLDRLRNEFSTAQKEMLSHDVQDRVNADSLSMSAACHLIHVTLQRQREILRLVDTAKDASSAFVRAQILRTDAEHRVHRPGRCSPWNRAAETKKKLVDRLMEAEQKHDFYQGLYREYASDFIKLATYIRDIITTKELKEFLGKHHDVELKLFRKIVLQLGEQADTEGG